MPRGVFQRKPITEEHRENLRKSHLGLKYKKRKPMSLEYRKRMSLRMMGKKYHLGFKNTEESKLKMSKAHKGKKKPWLSVNVERNRKIGLSRIGSKNPMWLGGTTDLLSQIRNLFEYKVWRKEVYERDSYKCVECGNSASGDFNADHIRPLSFLVRFYSVKNVQDALDCEEFWNISNGRTLCIKCHRRTKTWGIKARKYSFTT